MTKSYSGISSTIFHLARTIEVDLQIEDDAWPLRIELYRDSADETHFRARVWLLEAFRLQPTFPQTESGLPTDEPTDEELFVEWTYNLERDFDSFEADSDEEALDLVLSQIEDSLMHIAGNGHADA